jgi:hypothetical protein
MDVINFDILVTSPLKDTIPLYDDNDDLIGGGAPDREAFGVGYLPGLSISSIRCFVAARNHPVSLNLTSDLPVYVELIENNGVVQYGKITTVPPTKIGQYYFPVNKRYDDESTHDEV